MLHKIQRVTTKDNSIIEVIFFDGSIMEYDINQLLTSFPQFEILKTDLTLFNSVKVDQGGYGISWNDDLDLDAESIWENGIFVERKKSTDINHLLAYQLSMARMTSNMTQKELSEKTGIYQADISKLERAIGNPSLTTLQRLADGLEMELNIEFISKSREKE